MKLAARNWGDRGSAASGEVSEGRMRGYTNGYAQQHDPDAEVHSPAITANILIPCYLLTASLDCKRHAWAACRPRSGFCLARHPHALVA